MTKFQALYIKYLRIRCGGSWSWIGSKYDARYKYNLPFNYQPVMGNGRKGAQLAQEAMLLLNEKVEDGWN